MTIIINDYDEAVQQDGPLSRWRLDETSDTVAFDSGLYGNLNPGDIVGGVTLGISSPIAGVNTNKAMAFDGATGFISANAAWDVTGNQPFTMEAWIDPTVVDGAFRYIVSQDAVLNHGVYLAWQNGLGYYLLRGHTDATFDIAGGGAPVAGVWAHVVGTFDGSEMSLFVNGQLIQRIAVFSDCDASGAINIGSSVADVINGNAAIDEVALYDHALTPQRIFEHYRAGVTAFTSPVQQLLTYTVILGDPVSGQDVTQYFQQDQWSIDATYGQRGRTAQVLLVEDLQGKSDWALKVKPLSRITITDANLNQIIFGGIVMSPRLYRDGPVRNEWQLTCKDGTFYADNKIVKGDYSNATLDFILKDLTTQANCGITTNNVIPGPQIARVVINYLQLSEAWKKACGYASQGALWGWDVDDALDLHSFNGLATTPLGVPKFTDIPSLVDGVTYFPFVQDGFYYEWAGDSMRNRIKVRGGNYTGPATDTFTGDGAKAIFAITYPIDTAQPGLSTTVNGGNIPISIDTTSSPSSTVPAGTAVMTQVPSGQWYARFGTIPGNGQAIVVNYNFLMPVLTQVDDVPSQQAYSLQPSGLTDGAFELASGNWVASNGGSGTATIETAHPHMGAYDLALTNPSTPNYGGMYNMVGIPVVAGQKLTLSAFLKGSIAGFFSSIGGGLRLTYANPGTVIDSDGIASAQPSTQAGSGVVDFKNFKITTVYARHAAPVFTVPVGYSFVFVELYARGAGEIPTTYIDDVAVQVASPNAGVFEMYMSDPTITSLLTAKARGQREIAEYGNVEERVFFKTFPSNSFHVRSGDVISLSSTLVPDSNKDYAVGTLAGL